MNGRVLRMLYALLLAGSLMPSSALAQAGSDPAPLQFTDRAEEKRFHALVSDLRCVMCQNQSLADSDAQIAHDLRREVLDLMHAGKTDDEIEQFLVARYGEFVLYRPRVGSKTWLLWFGPLLLLLTGGYVVTRVVRLHAGPGKLPLPPDDGGNDRQEW